MHLEVSHAGVYAYMIRGSSPRGDRVATNVFYSRVARITDSGCSADTLKWFKIHGANPTVLGMALLTRVYLKSSRRNPQTDITPSTVAAP